MSHIKQTQQTSVLRSQVNSRPQRRVDQSENRPIGHGRAHVQTGVAQTNIRPVSTRTDNMHPLPKGAPPISEVETHSILKRSLSKLRIKDAISPSKHNTVQAQAKRGPLQPASKIPQAPAPSTARIIGARPDQSAFVVHGLTPPRTRHMHQNDTQQNAQQKPHAVSPARDKNNADIRSKAMQLGIFKISETDLKDRFQFLEEIGTFMTHQFDIDVPSIQALTDMYCSVLTNTQALANGAASGPSKPCDLLTTFPAPPTAHSRSSSSPALAITPSTTAPTSVRLLSNSASASINTRLQPEPNGCGTSSKCCVL